MGERLLARLHFLFFWWLEGGKCKDGVGIHALL